MKIRTVFMLTDIHRLLTSIHSVLPSILLYLWICWMYLVAFFIFLFWIIHLTKHADQFWLLQAELFCRFKEKNPDCKIGMRMFEMLKPFFCRRLKDRYTCCYEYHVQISFLKDALNHMRSQDFGLHGTSCNCVCSIYGGGDNIGRGFLASHHTFKGVT